MKRILLFVFTSGALLLTSCQPVRPKENIATETPYVVASTLTSTPVSVLVPTSTPITIACDPSTTDFCLMDWQATFKNPLGLDSPLTIARSYSYGSTENGKRDPHRGVDLESKEGEPVYAPAVGTVIFAGRDHDRVYTPWDDYYGNLIVLQHEDGLFTLYGHLSQINVSVGTQVNIGDVMGAVGHTGVAIGSHLHFEVRIGGNGTDFYSTENPELWLPLVEGMGGIAFKIDAGNAPKLQRQLVLYRYVPGKNKIAKKYYFSSYPKSFEHNNEDWAINGLPPGRYRIAFGDSGNLYERIVNVEVGKLTQVVVKLK
ncbi:MAG: M23 family metallopeptidase [Anaerolineales bacterium]